MRRLAAAEAVAEAPEREPLALREVAKGELWVDLIHHQPRVTVDAPLLRSAIRFAFESGDAGGLLSVAVDEAPLAPSGFAQAGPGDSFTTGLFLPELASKLFGIHVDETRYEPSQRHLLRLLTAPPDDQRDVALRQEVLAELAAKPELREGLARSYVALRGLRDLLDDRPMTPGETLKRKIEVLATIGEFLKVADEGLVGATSAIARLQEFASTARTLDAHRRLLELLEFDKEMAQVTVRLVLGADGTIRDYRLVRADERTDNPLVRSPWRRLWSRFVGWLRGYKYGENEVILKVIDDVFTEFEDVIVPCFALIGDLELYLSSLAFSDRASEVGLEVCLPSFIAQGEQPTLKRLFNPLLLLQDVVPVPCDIDTAHDDAIVLITGPNSGGKTRVLQAIALTQLLGQVGLFVPAAEARLVRAPKMFVSLIEEAPADQKEGRLGTELMRVRRLFEELEPGSLVILDELCSGTNPSEGIAIFEMVLGLLPRLRPRAFLTTHFLDAARRLAEAPPTDRLEVLQVELDEKDDPTYQFVPGVAPTSLAHAVAARLGVTAEELNALVDRHQ